MACDLTSGRAVKCKDQVGGLKNAYFINYDEMSGVTYNVTNTDVIATITGAGTINAYRWELKGVSTFSEVFNSSRETGTSSAESTLVLSLKTQSLADHKEIKLMTYGRPRVILEDHNGNFRLMGLEHGAEVTTANANSGAAMNDGSGYEVTLVSTEKIFANFMEATDEAGLGTAGLTVVTA
jgi:hypothetical protein